MTAKVGKFAEKVSLTAALNSIGGMSEVESIIRGRLGAEAPLLSTISEYLLSLGGKRIRPILALLCGELFGIKSTNRYQELLDVAAGIELIHMATLLHDDIIDKSPLRRHKESPLVRFGQDQTLLTGDFLLVRAFGLCARLDRFVIDQTEAACVALTEGEILEVPLHLADHTRKSSLNIAHKKTAALFRLAAVCGGHLSGGNEGLIGAMGDYGDALGTAFQILDDVLDVSSDEDLLGKKSGQDIRERKPSLVNVLWLESGHPGAQRLKTEPSPDDEAWVKESVQFLRTSSCLAEARHIATAEARRAREALDRSLKLSPRPHSEKAYKLLIALTEYILERVH